MATMDLESNNKQHWYKSPWLIGWLLLVLTVIAVNAYMIMQSMNDFPGLVVEDFYERGQNYEENIHKKIANNEKWLTHFTISEALENKPTTIHFTITDKNHVFKVAEKVTLFAYRPSNSKKDFSVDMTLVDNKYYQSTMNFNSKGKWDLLASVIIDGVEVNYAKKLFVKEQ